MFALDLRTIVVIAGVMGILLALLLDSMRRTYPASIKGLREWTLAAAITVVGALLVATRGRGPDWLSIIVANMLLMSGNMLVYLGVQRFYGQAPATRVMLGVLTLIGGALTWFTLVEPNYGARVVLVTGFVCCFSLAAVLLLVRHAGRSFPAWFLIVILLIRVAVAFWRFLVGLQEGPAGGLFDTSSAQMAYLMTNSLVLLAAMVGLMLLASNRLRRELEHLARHDPLTGTLTRRALIDEAEQELDRCRRHGRSMVMLMLDLDHFKGINDGHGHLVGDRVLIDFVARVGEALRRSDKLGRYGGEEFVVLLPETGVQEARIVAERIRAKVQVHKPGIPAYTVSIGGAVNQADEGKIEALLDRADEALYKAKDAGRNCVVMA